MHRPCTDTGLGRSRPLRHGALPAAEAWAAEELSLPMHPDLRSGRDRTSCRCGPRSRSRVERLKGDADGEANDITTRRHRRPADPVGVAVVGLGYWGPNLLRVLADNPNVEVRWICDLDRERLAKYRRRHPAARVTTRFERVLQRPRRRGA